MRRVASPSELPAALAAGSAEAASAFGDGAVFLEREIRPARHIEVQLLGDAMGSIVAIGERDCSLQRRHQKLIEEAPAPGLTTAERRHLHDLAVRVATAGGLRNAATAEFLRDADGAFHFLEVNTRLQVEHGVTELVAGIDIVHEQFRLAAGRAALGRGADRCRACRRAGRVTPSRSGWRPRTRRVTSRPARAGSTAGSCRPAPACGSTRVSGPATGSRPTTTTSSPRSWSTPGIADAAIDRLRRALDETEIAGIQTTLPFDRFVARHDGFRAGDLSIEWVGEHWDGPAERARHAPAAAEAAARSVSVAAGSPALPDRTGTPTRTAADSPWAIAARADATDRWPG